MTARLDQCHPI